MTTQQETRREIHYGNYYENIYRTYADDGNTSILTDFLLLFCLLYYNMSEEKYSPFYWKIIGNHLFCRSLVSSFPLVISLPPLISVTQFPRAHENS